LAVPVFGEDEFANVKMKPVKKIRDYYSKSVRFFHDGLFALHLL